MAEVEHSWQALTAASSGIYSECDLRVLYQRAAPAITSSPHVALLLQFTNQQGLPWLGAAVAAIPEAVATAEDKQKVLAAAQQLLNPPEASNPRT